MVVANWRNDEKFAERILSSSSSRRSAAMPDLQDGESTEMKGSGAKPYVLKNMGGVYSCSCPAWRNQSTPIERRTCKHLRKLRGDDAEQQRVGAPANGIPVAAPKA